MTDAITGILKGVRYHRESGGLILLDGQLFNPFHHQWVTETVGPGMRPVLARYYILVLDEREVGFAKTDGSQSFVETFVKFFYRFWPEAR